MSVIQGLNNLANVVRAGTTTRAPQGLKPYLAIESPAAGDFRRARTRLLNLFARLEELAELTNITTRFKLDLPDALSAAGLGIDLTTTAATLSSTEEINATPTSFSPFSPLWNDGSSAALGINGEYNGDQGSGSLTFEVRRAGVHGADNLRIRVEDPQGNPLQTINIRDNDPLNQQYDIGNGLFLTLGPGALINRDTATIQVFDNVGSVVNPDNPLGGLLNSNPNLQFGTVPIVDGSFQVNGATINVTTADSINDVISRINQSAAGVTASFNAGTEGIDFSQNTTGSVPTIDLQNDTSNLLDALKLSAATVIPGIDPDDEKPLDSVAALSSIQAGDIIINGNLIAVDPSTDSLDTVLDRINASGANVIATFDPGTQRVKIEATNASTELVIDSNGTDFFAALNMVEGRVDPEAVSSGVTRARSYAIADAATAVFAELSALFRDSTFVGRDANASQFRGPLESALRATLGEDLTTTLFGLVFDGSSGARQRGDFASIDRQSLTQNLQLRGDAVKDVLTNSDGTAGLVPDLLRATQQALSGVNQALGLSGTFVDTFA